MTKEFVPYEQALELKELGFDEPCFGWFRSTLIPSNFTEFFLETEFGMNESPSDWVNSNFLDEACSAPLYQQAFRWFREKYKLHYSIDYECSQHDFKWGYNYTIYNYNQVVKTDEEYITSHPNAPTGEWVYETHEEAEFACLNKLIEIVKNC